jgi:hypothetical protein
MKVGVERKSCGGRRVDVGVFNQLWKGAAERDS